MADKKNSKNKERKLESEVISQKSFDSVNSSANVNPKKEKLIEKEEKKTAKEEEKLSDRKDTLEDIREAGHESSDKELVAEAKKKVKTFEQKFGNWFVVSVFVINIFVLFIALYLQSAKFGVANIGSLFDTQYRLRYVFYALMITIGLMLLEMLQVYVLLFKATKKSHPFISYKCAAMGKYCGSIFGVATAGKPYQVFYLNSKGFSPGVSTSIPVVSYTLYQFVFAVVSFVVLITSFSVFAIEPSSKIIFTLSIISLVITFIMIVAILFMSLSKRAAPILAIKILKLLKKMKIVKHYDKAVFRIAHVLADYRRSMRYLLQNFTTLFVSLFVNIATIALTAVLPYFIYCIFYVPTPTTFLEIFAKVIICNLAMKYIPLPGGVGIAELSFTVLFANMFTEGTLFWAMLFWRIFSSYGYMFQGLLFLVYSFIEGRVQAKKKVTSK